MRIVVSGKLRPGQRVSVTRAVPRPNLFTAHTARAQALLAGVEFTGGVRVVTDEPPAELDELAIHESPPLDVLAAMVNKPSDNFLADRVIMTAGARAFGGKPSLPKGVKAMTDYLKKIGIAQGSYLLENGSGLSRSNHMSARQVAQVLLAAYKHDGISEPFFDSLAVGGRDGTLRGRFRGRPSEGHVFGKTGTLNGVAALSGFVTTDGSDPICFAILTNGFRNSRKTSVRTAQAQIVDAIYAYLRTRPVADSEPAPVPALAPDPAPAPEPVPDPAAPAPETPDPDAPASDATIVDENADADSDSDSDSDSDPTAVPDPEPTLDFADPPPPMQ
jgi:D-alanyl-D-alanine carboxypeptidase